MIGRHWLSFLPWLMLEELRQKTSSLHDKDHCYHHNSFEKELWAYRSAGKSASQAAHSSLYKAQKYFGLWGTGTFPRSCGRPQAFPCSFPHLLALQIPFFKKKLKIDSFHKIYSDCGFSSLNSYQIFLTFPRTHIHIPSCSLSLKNKQVSKKEIILDVIKAKPI